MQWNIAAKIISGIWKTEYPLVIARERKKNKNKNKKYSIIRSLQDMIFIDYWYFWILHWEIAKWNDEHHNRTKYKL